MICAKCEICKDTIPGEEVLQKVVEKIKHKREQKDKCKEPIFSKREGVKLEERIEVKHKSKRQPSAYNKFLSEYLKKPELKDILPKMRMSKAAEAWKISKQQS